MGTEATVDAKTRRQIEREKAEARKGLDRLMQPTAGHVARIQDRERFRRNYLAVFGAQPRARTGRYVMHEGRLTHVDDLPADRVVTRKADSKGLVSESIGCLRSQVEQFNRDLQLAGFTPHEARYAPDGKLHMKDRQTKLRVMRMRGVVDYDEVRGGRSR